ncbi:hypothetical protein ACIBJE_02250 [Micromonospora sp. NPDC050187]|uniref:hypothetical protein n=1 Tax=Micromonospora sp. NPDC050187 TaxID=3364277 RepID=UPI003798A799
MSLPTVSPAVLAQFDAHRAELVHLVATAREHVDAEACDYPRTCSGPAVTAVLEEIPVDELAALLALAVAELSALGYGRDLDHPARALLAELEPPRGDNDDRG